MRTPECGAALVACTPVVPLCVSHALFEAPVAGAIDGASDPRLLRGLLTIVACAGPLGITGCACGGGVASGIFTGGCGSCFGAPALPSITVLSADGRAGATPTNVLRGAAT